MNAKEAAKITFDVRNTPLQEMLKECEECIENAANEGKCEAWFTLPSEHKDLYKELFDSIQNRGFKLDYDNGDLMISWQKEYYNFFERKMIED